MFSLSIGLLVWTICGCVFVSFDDSPHDSYWKSAIAMILVMGLDFLILGFFWLYLDDDIENVGVELMKHRKSASALVLSILISYSIHLAYWANVLVDVSLWWKTNPLLIVWTVLPIGVFLLNRILQAVVAVLVCLQTTCRRDVVQRN
jgi:hypothetical protein